MEFKYKAKDGNTYTATFGNEEDFKRAINELRPSLKNAQKTKADTYKPNLHYSGEYVDFISIVWRDETGKAVGFDAHALMRTKNGLFIKGRPTWFDVQCRGLGLGSVNQVLQELYWRRFPDWVEARFIRHVNNASSKKMVASLGFTEHTALPHSKWVMHGKNGRKEVDEYAKKYSLILSN